MAKNRKRKPMSGRRHKIHQDRCRRLAQHLTWYGVGLPGDDEYRGGVDFPRHLLTDHQATEVSQWAIATPNRWWCRVTIFCERHDGERYQEVHEAELMQAVLANEVADWRIGLVEEAKARCNPKHIVMEQWQTGVMA